MPESAIAECAAVADRLGVDPDKAHVILAAVAPLIRAAERRRCELIAGNALSHHTPSDTVLRIRGDVPFGLA